MFVKYFFGKFSRKTEYSPNWVRPSAEVHYNILISIYNLAFLKKMRFISLVQSCSKSNVLHINRNLAQGYIDRCWLRFWYFFLVFVPFNCFRLIWSNILQFNSNFAQSYILYVDYEFDISSTFFSIQFFGSNFGPKSWISPNWMKLIYSHLYSMTTDLHFNAKIHLLGIFFGTLIQDFAVWKKTPSKTDSSKKFC